MFCVLAHATPAQEAFTALCTTLFILKNPSEVPPLKASVTSPSATAQDHGQISLWKTALGLHLCIS